MGSRHHWIDGTPAFERACADAERAQALAEQAYLASQATYTLSAIGIERTVTGTLAEVIALAREIDAEYQRAYGVTITDADGNTIATVDDGQIA